MKTPRDIADRMTTRKANAVLRETWRLQHGEARRRMRQLFEEFPSSSYMTEIETWREIRGTGMVEVTWKRLPNPIEREGLSNVLDGERAADGADLADRRALRTSKWE